jgi:DNA-binding CsgD family transcriptional regulator
VNAKERSVVILILCFVAVMAATDILTDYRGGAAAGHILVEAGVGLAALAGIFYFLKGSIKLKHKLNYSLSENVNLKNEANEWKVQAEKHIDGLSKSIDLQLSKWNLSDAEKEVALLLLKGLSLKEIAQVRDTTEKTSRVQAISVYAKTGLSGRAELSAFFLEDLLQPQKSAETIGKEENA